MPATRHPWPGTRELNQNQAGCYNKKTQEHKNTNNAHSTVSAETSFCQYIRMSIKAKSFAVQSTVFLKGTKERPYVLTQQNKVVDSAPQVHSIEE